MRLRLLCQILFMDQLFLLQLGFMDSMFLIGTTFLFVCFFRLLSNQFTRRQHVGFEAASWY